MLWDANSEDGWLARPEQIMAWSMRESGNFSILLMHSKPTTAAVLDRCLRVWKGVGSDSCCRLPIFISITATATRKLT